MAGRPKNGRDGKKPLGPRPGGEKELSFRQKKLSAGKNLSVEISFVSWRKSFSVGKNNFLIGK